MKCLPDSVKVAIFDHAAREVPREACGLVLVKGGRASYHPCRNLAQSNDQFVLAPEDYAHAEECGDIVAIVHSHPNASANPSQADRVACEASGLPWHIVGIPSGVWAYIEPCGYLAPLVGREWAHGVLDCYSLIRDWYRIERGIELRDFHRDDEWWTRGENLYLDNFQQAGFRRLADGEDLQVGDGILMQVLSNVPNHAAVYLGDGIILHHLHGRLSSRDVYGGYWLKHTALVVRYAS